MSLLSSHQNFFVSKLSRLIIKEEDIVKHNKHLDDINHSEETLSSGYSSGALAKRRAKEAEMSK